MKILFITLSNIGDVILTLPVLDALRKNYPQAKITVIAGPRPKEIFQNNPGIDKLIIFDKHSRLRDKIKLFRELRKQRFDMVYDLRNSFFGAFLPAKYRISPFMAIPKNITHMKDRHLFKLSAMGYELSAISRSSLYIKPEDEEYIDKIFKENNITDKDRIIVIAPGARSQVKRWPQDKFVGLISHLAEEFKVKIILVGDKDDAPIVKYIAGHINYPVLDLSGKTNLTQLGCLLAKSGCLITNDSASLHLASYLNIPVVAIFGPTDEKKYGPWSSNYAVVKKDIFCRPCEKAQCRFLNLKCLQLIKSEDVLRAVRKVSTSGSADYRVTSEKENFSRILIVRTDRIGDVLLSTPVIKAIRETYPHAYIAVMVSSYAKEIVEGNPYLDEVIVYDKDHRHKGWLSSIKFALNLKKKKFNLAVILHPTNRVHLITFFAGIPKRIGYDRKFGFLLTDRIKHTKQLGQKHELEYSLDLLGHLGIHGQDKNIFIPIKAESEKWVEDLFDQEKIDKLDRLLAIHPGASCPSKIWPQDRFAQAADRLVEEYGFKVLIIAGPKDIAHAKVVARNMRHAVIDLSGKTSISQLASVLKRCRLFISNDSGPVHIASAVGTPVISIFGRNQKGLSPKRWGPVGKKDRVLHKEVGCIQCLAHNCVKEFACLKAITVEDVVKVADSILKE